MSEAPHDTDPIFQSGLTDRLHDLVAATSRATIAELAGVSIETVRRYLLGSAPSFTAVFQLCEALDMSSDWLLFGLGSRQRSCISAEVLAQLPTEDLYRAISRRMILIPGALDSGNEKVDTSDLPDTSLPLESLTRIEPKPLRLKLLEGPAHQVELSILGEPPAQITLARESDFTPWRILDPGEAAALPIAVCYRRFIGRTFRWVRPPPPELPAPPPKPPARVRKGVNPFAPRATPGRHLR